MIKHAEIAVGLSGCLLGSLSLLASAQDKQPNEPVLPQNSAPGVPVMQQETMLNLRGEPAADSAKPTVNVFTTVGGQQAEKIRQQIEERQAQLRTQLADPKQRAQIVAERIEQQRLLNRDLAALLRLDARTEERLLALLAEQQLSQELARSQFGVFARAGTLANGTLDNPMLGEAQQYTQRMIEIGKVIGASRLDEYVDYQSRMIERNLVERFDQRLPAVSKLTLEQRKSLVELLHQQNTVFDAGIAGPPLSFDLSLSAEERNRRMRVINITGNERLVKLRESANRDLLDRAASILTPEQSAALAQWKQQELDQQRAWTQAQRRELGVGPDEELAAPEEARSSRPLSKNLRLSIDLTVNDMHLVKQLTSVRGSPVTFQTTEGLSFEVRPYLAQEQLMAELKAYELVRGSKHAIGQMRIGARLIETGKPSLQLADGASTILRGRKGYALTWSVSGTYL